MDKDEMKNRISLALKDPILQQGFEIICKENAELEKEVVDLQGDREIFLSDFYCDRKGGCKVTELEKENAELKELIKKFSEFVNNDVEYDPEHPQEHTDLWNKLCEEAEQFLNCSEKPNS